MNCSGHCLEASLARNGTVVAATGQVWVLPWGQTKQGCSAPAADHHDGLTPLQLGVIISSCVGVVVCIACCGALLYRRLGPAKRERSKSIGDTFREMVSADEAERVHVNPASHAQISSVSVCERGVLRTTVHVTHSLAVHVHAYACTYVAAGGDEGDCGHVGLWLALVAD